MQFDWTAPDGKILPAEKWLPGSAPRAVVIGVHGLGGAADYFGSFGRFLAASGIATYAINLRGQGNDPEIGDRGAYLDLPAIGRDVTSFTQQTRSLHPEVPVFFCGESMGSLILAWMNSEGLLSDAQGVIFSVPVVALINPTPWIVRELVRVMAILTPGMRFSPSWFVVGKAKPLAVTRDAVYDNYIRTAPHRVPVFTLRTLATLGRLIDSSAELARKIDKPSLVLAAGDDVFVRVGQIEDWFDEIPATDKTMHVYPQAYHLLWNDSDADEVLGHVRAWLNGHLGSAA